MQTTAAGAGPCASDAARLVRLLADGEARSGAWLAQALGVSRDAVSPAIKWLRNRGIDIDAVAGCGYCLPHAVELLDATCIRGAVTRRRAASLCSLEVLFDVDSTNTRLLAAAAPPRGSVAVILSELQHAGRGRRGRQWIAPFGGGISLSLGWSFADASHANPALSLCVGVAVARALERLGAEGIRLKWPNDLWFEDRKVGGVLLELRAEAGGSAYVVIGVGVNVSLTPRARQQIAGTGTQVTGAGVQAAAVADACPSPPSRNFVAGAIIDELLSMLEQFEREGFAAFQAAWTVRDALRDRRAHVVTGDELISGVARGVNSHGAMRLEIAGLVREFGSGEVSLRLRGDDI